MGIEIRTLQKKDQSKAIGFAITGMHFDWYLKNSLLRKAYGRYFWYLETNRATQIIAAYEGDTLAGVLLAEVYGEEPQQYSPWKGAYVKFVDWVQRAFFGGSAGAYDAVNRELFAAYRKQYSPDGEIIFLAANPEAKTKGIGTLLLQELTRREPGKRVFLYTDDACTYQFYEHRGFDRVGEKDVTLELPDGTLDLKCLLYSKVL